MKAEEMWKNFWSSFTQHIHFTLLDTWRMWERQYTFNYQQTPYKIKRRKLAQASPHLRPFTRDIKMIHSPFWASGTIKTGAFIRVRILLFSAIKEPEEHFWIGTIPSRLESEWKYGGQELKGKFVRAGHRLELRLQAKSQWCHCRFNWLESIESLYILCINSLLNSINSPIIHCTASVGIWGFEMKSSSRSGKLWL